MLFPLTLIFSYVIVYPIGTRELLVSEDETRTRQYISKYSVDTQYSHNSMYLRVRLRSRCLRLEPESSVPCTR